MFSSLENIYDTIKKNGYGSINDYINGKTLEIDTDLAIDQAFVSVVEKQGLVFANNADTKKDGINYMGIEFDFIVK